MPTTEAQILTRLAELRDRVARLSNGELSTIKAEMMKIAANSQLVVQVVQEHGQVLGEVRRLTEQLQLRCPMISAEPAAPEDA